MLYDLVKKGALEHTVRANIRNSQIPVAVTQATAGTSTGQGLAPQGLTSKGLIPPIIILPSSDKQLKKDLGLIIASIHAGNDSTEMKNKGLVIIDELKK